MIGHEAPAGGGEVVAERGPFREERLRGLRRQDGGQSGFAGGVPGAEFALPALKVWAEAVVEHGLRELHETAQGGIGGVAVERDRLGKFAGDFEKRIPRVVDFVDEIGGGVDGLADFAGAHLEPELVGDAEGFGVAERLLG